MRERPPTHAPAANLERPARWGAAALALLGLLVTWWLPLPADAAGAAGTTPRAPAGAFGTETPGSPG